MHSPRGARSPSLYTQPRITAYLPSSSASLSLALSAPCALCGAAGTLSTLRTLVLEPLAGIEPKAGTPKAGTWLGSGVRGQGSDSG